MPQSLANTVYSTKDCRPFLRDPELRQELHRYVGGILAQLDCQPITKSRMTHGMCGTDATLSGLWTSNAVTQGRPL